jgi:hypothetical protein
MLSYEQVEKLEEAIAVFTLSLTEDGKQIDSRLQLALDILSDLKEDLENAIEAEQRRALVGKPLDIREVKSPGGK